MSVSEGGAIRPIINDSFYKPLVAFRKCPCFIYQGASYWPNWLLTEGKFDHCNKGILIKEAFYQKEILIKRVSCMNMKTKETFDHKENLHIAFNQVTKQE